MGCVYQARNKVNGKCYIGKTIGKLARRRWEHENDMVKGSTCYFHRALRKYGTRSFEWSILCVSNNELKLFSLEQKMIVLCNTKEPYGYNLTDGGDGVRGRVGWHHSAETRAKIRAGNVGKCHPTAGAKIGARHRGKKRGPRPIEVRTKISIAHKGFKFSLESRLKMRESQKLNASRVIRDSMGRFVGFLPKKVRNQL